VTPSVVPSLIEIEVLPHPLQLRLSRNTFSSMEINECDISDNSGSPDLSSESDLE
jgi:hypothetical protein